jgi:SynChlorMet cassette radical SAM/SPASM protein ScmF
MSDSQKSLFPLTSLYLYLSDRCNLRCSHCWITPTYSLQKENGISLEVLKKTIHEAIPLGLQSVKLSGGEPFLYKDILLLIKFLCENDLTIYIETNGTLIDDLCMDACRDAGVSQISISLDAASHQIHDAIRGVKGSFDKTVQGIERVCGAGLNCQVINTLQRRNKDELEKMIALCKKLGVGSLKINHLIPCGRGVDSFNRGESLTLEELADYYQQVNVCRSNNQLDVIFDLPSSFKTIDDLTIKKINECNILGILGILANGDYSICGIGQTIKELRMGNVYKNRIETVWETDPILLNLRKSLPNKLKGICGDCIFKFQCMGGCRANAYFLTGNFFSPYFLCEELYMKKRFPPSRRINHRAYS